MTARPLPLARLGALALALGPAAALAAGGTPLTAGSVVEFDLSGLPARYEGGAKASCTGTTITATGPTPTTCERTYRFAVPPGGVRMTYVFTETRSGRESRIDLPLTRSERPVTFRVPADGTLQPPASVALPPEAAVAAAKDGAASACAGCPGGDFSVASYDVTDDPKPTGGSPSVKLRITPAAPAPAPKR